MKFCRFPDCANGDTTLEAYKKCRECCIHQPKTREERIQTCMEENRSYPYAELTATRGHCEALVDGEDAVKPKTGVEISAMYQIDRGLLAKQENYNLKRIIKQMEQKNMTKEEAVKAVCTNWNGISDAFGFLLALEALGLIKFDEPKSAYEKLCDAMGDGAWTSSCIMSCINKAGLKIVEK